MRPRTLFRGGAGGYVAGVAATPVAIARPAPGPVPSLAIAAAVAVAGFVVGWTVAGRRSTAEAERVLTRTGPVLALFSVPVALVVAAVTAAIGSRGLGAFDVAALAPTIAGAGTAFLGALLAVHAAERHRADRLLAESDVVARLPGRYTKLRREHGRSLVALAVLYVAFVAAIGVAGAFDWTTAMIVLGVVPIAAAVWRNPDLIVLEDGLRSGAAVEPWSEYERFELTDESLRLYRAGWGAGRYEVPREAIEDEDAAIAALSTVLPREEVDRDATGPNGGVSA